MRWMIKDTVLSDYLQGCRDADLSNIEGNKVLMRMFNTKKNYRLHLENIVKYFGPLDGFRICEIGGGYGGQAKIILDVYSPACYHIIDLPEVCELQMRFLQGTIAEPHACMLNEAYDVVISNYALSEIIDNKPYIDSVLRRSKHGYVTCNTDFVQLDWEHRRLPDVKGERKENYILIW